MCIGAATFETKCPKSVLKKQHVQRNADHNRKMRKMCLLRLAIGYVLFRLKRNEEVKTELHVLSVTCVT